MVPKCFLSLRLPCCCNRQGLVLHEMPDPTSHPQGDHYGRPHDILPPVRPCIAGATLAVALFPVHPHVVLPPCQPFAVALFPALALFALVLSLIAPLSLAQLLV